MYGVCNADRRLRLSTQGYAIWKLRHALSWRKVAPLVGGLTGLTGIIVTISCQLRGGRKDVQRSVFQPVDLATIVISAVPSSIFR
jgi:hypothetical protein